MNIRKISVWTLGIILLLLMIGPGNPVQPSALAKPRISKTSHHVAANKSNTKKSARAHVTASEGMWGTCPVTLSDDKVLTIYPGTLGTNEEMPSFIDSFSVDKIIFRKGVILPKNSSKLFFAIGVNSFEGINDLDTSHVTNMRQMFQYDHGLQGHLDLSNWDTSHVTDMGAMFASCFGLSSINVADWDTKNVTDMNYLFGEDSFKNLEISNWNTDKVTDMGSMFQGDEQLTHLNISNWDTNNVIYMPQMFKRMPKLQSLDLSKWNTRKLLPNPDGPTQDIFTGDTNLWQLKLGPNTVFDGTEGLITPPGNNTALPDGSGNLNIGPKWMAVDQNGVDNGTGDVHNPAGQTYSVNELYNKYNPQTTNAPVETYVWQQKTTPAPITIKYVDENGNVILPDKQITGEFGSAYDASTIQYKVPTINYNGSIYNLDNAKLPPITVLKGNIGAIKQTITFVYQKAPTPTPNPVNPVNPVVPNPPVTPVIPTNPEKPATPGGTQTNYAVVKGEAVYAVKKIYMYKSPNFNKSNRKVRYNKLPRTKRPMFVVTGYSRSNNGALRYRVRDVNHQTKNDGKKGYITASTKYVVPVYYQSIPKSRVIKVINSKGIHAYKNRNLTARVRSYKKNTRLHVKKIVKHNLTTRYQLTNGRYITGNKLFVIQSKR